MGVLMDGLKARAGWFEDLRIKSEYGDSGCARMTGKKQATARATTEILAAPE